jgi:serine phosphatase RsbU (regulator of sigma subunit)
VPDSAAREHEIAEELQASLLPDNAFDLEHLDVASYYRAGVQGTQVGGDWYDVISLRDGRTALVVGDVMGRGVRAAAVMGQLRTAVRAYALLGLPPDELMASLDDLVHDLFPEQVVTAIYAVFDPASRSLRFVNAGHVPALLTRADGTCTALVSDPHPPVGMGVPFDRVHHVDLQPLDGVLLYTDGLVERRGHDLDDRIETLRRLVEELDGAVAEMPERLARSLLPEGPDDDVAILVAKVRTNSAGAVRKPADVQDLLGDGALGGDQLEPGSALLGGAQSDGQHPDTEAR